mgnify:CR=1 FL=1|jgi:hypothetical protein
MELKNKKVNSTISTMEKIIKYYQENKEEFFIDCLQSDENERQYLYNDWIEDYFETSTLNK